ncbi:hypothetical protein [Candidatus Clostridium radicumherbarum]|uniref:Flagellar hook-length control protein-like C-terminal domain-containing protein n=1 Tax=Candidatus Clostridium radicumherbarum TaxID=3381662 RepID=A0ABW8TT62_9CLOT
MSGISNIIGAYNINPKRISSKLSFEVGQVFSAKIVSTGELSKELILRLLDGWQFPAKLQMPLEFAPEGLVKFQVEGFSDGKLQIKLVNSSKDQDELDKNTIEDLLLQSKIDVDKEDYDILNNMIKHNMPLTKENISKVKTIFDFRDKLLNDTDEADNFILKFINSKNIEPDSAEGIKIKDTLYRFFNALKNISEDEILTMLENNIDLTEENIKSFLRVNNEPSTIYKELYGISKQMNINGNHEEDISNLLLRIKEAPNAKEEINKLFQELKLKDESSSLNSKESSLFDGIKKLLQENMPNKEMNKLINLKGKDNSFDNINPKTIETADNGNKDSNNIISDKNNETLESEFEKIDKSFKALSEKNSDIDKDKVINLEKNSENKDVEDKVTAFKSSSKDNISLVKNQLEDIVKEEFSNKTETMKNIIKEVIDKIDKTKPELMDKVIQGLKDNINDFKVFNSISNQYYYLDIPINLNREEYNCKLLIKDDRKTGKKIDSKNVSMVVSVKTGNIGVVDAYMKVKEQNMNVTIKCDENWIKLLSSGKNRIMNELKELGYNTFLNIEKRDLGVNVITCRDFFDDSSLSSINVKV